MDNDSFERARFIDAYTLQQKNTHSTSQRTHSQSALALLFKWRSRSISVGWLWCMAEYRGSLMGKPRLSLFSAMRAEQRDALLPRDAAKSSAWNSNLRREREGEKERERE